MNRPMLNSKFRNSHIGEFLKKSREAANVTQAELAEACGIMQSALSRVEGQSDLKFSTLIQFLDGIGADLNVSATVRGMTINLFSDIFGDSQEQLVLDIPDVGDRSRDVVLSIKPHYADKIIRGEKTVELRRRFTSKIEAGSNAFIYSTTPTRALTGIAKIDEVHSLPKRDIWRKFAERACVTKAEFDAYFNGVPSGVAIELDRAAELDEPIALGELRRRFNFAPPQSFLYAGSQLRNAIAHECPDFFN